MAWPETLSAAQQAAVQNYVDQVFRPAVLSLAKALAASQITVVPQYLSSPTGLASSMASPAADSVAGLLAALPQSDVVPILNSGLPLDGPLLVSKIVAYTAALNNLVTSNFTASIQQDLAQIVGTPNII
ncbi:MAG TPA: hypothetical protein VGF75_02775 [Candidatus Saccharimonadales bacterium]|jgi:hypothetical protein